MKEDFGITQCDLKKLKGEKRKIYGRVAKPGIRGGFKIRW